MRGVTTAVEVRGQAVANFYPVKASVGDRVWNPARVIVTEWGTVGVWVDDRTADPVWAGKLADGHPPLGLHHGNGTPIQTEQGELLLVTVQLGCGCQKFGNPPWM